jgi:hypothetical protein
LSAIREKLGSGEISRMHQVNFKGQWMVLDEFLEKHDGSDPAARRQAALQKRKERLRRTFENDSSGLIPEPFSQDDSASGDPLSPLSRLLPRPLFPGQDEPLPLPEPDPAEPARTSGLAIASLVMAFCNFVPYLNFVTWIAALICGHIALSQIDENPGLKGRGLAIAGLLITYFLLIMAIALAVLLLSHNQRLF